MNRTSAIRRINTLLLLIFFTTGFYACEKNSTDYHLIIDNRSSDTLFLVLEGNSLFLAGKDSIKARPGKLTMFGNVEDAKEMMTVNNDCNPRLFGDEITLWVSGYKTLNKDITDKTNWYCAAGKNQKALKLIFTFTADDLE